MEINNFTMWLNLLEPYIPILIFLIIIGAPMAYGTYLLYRYSQPYRLYKATTKERWGWAAKSVFFMYLPFLFMAIFYPLITPDKNADWVDSLFCVGIWFAIYPFLVLGQIVRFGFDLSVHNLTSKNIKKWRKAGMNSPFPALPVFFPDRETQRFFREGFPEEIVEGEQRNSQVLQKEKPVYQSPSSENDWQLNIYGPTKKSPVFYAHFKNNLQGSEDYLFPFGSLKNQTDYRCFGNCLIMFAVYILLINAMHCFIMETTRIHRVGIVLERKRTIIFRKMQ